MILGLKPITLNVMTSSELQLTCMTSGHELNLRGMVDMKNLGYEPKTLDSMKNS